MLSGFQVIESVPHTLLDTEFGSLLKEHSHRSEWDGPNNSRNFYPVEQVVIRLTEDSFAKEKLNTRMTEWRNARARHKGRAGRELQFGRVVSCESRH